MGRLLLSWLLFGAFLKCVLTQTAARVEKGADGKLVFTDFEPFCEYRAQDDFEPTRSAFFGNIATGFIRLVAPGRLATVIQDIDIEAFQENAGVYLIENYSTFVTAFVAIPVFFILGLILALLVPCIGAIFCCCRCCDNCGGEMLQNKEDNNLWKRWGLVSFLLCTALLLGIGCASVFLGGRTFTGSVETAINTIDTTNQDWKCYTNSIFKEFEYLVETANETVLLAVEEIQTTSEDVMKLLDDDIDTVFKRVVSLDQSAQSISDSLVLVDDVKSSEMDLRDALAVFTNNYNATLMSEACQNDMACKMTADQFDSEQFIVNTDFQTLADVSQQQNSLNEFLAKNLSGKANKLLSDIDPILNVSQAGSFELPQSFDTNQFNTLTQDSLSQVDTLFDSISYAINDPNVDNVASQVTQYGFAGSAVLASLIGVISALYILGIIFGEIGRKRDDEPTERECLAKCGGCMLVLGWVFSFLFYFTVAMLAAWYFLFGSVGEIFLCQPLGDPSTFDALQPLLFQANLSSSGVASFQNISLSAALRSCENNEPLWESLNLDDFFGSDIDTIINDLRDAVDVSSLIDPIDLQDTLNFEESSFLTDLGNIDFSALDYAQLTTELDESPVVDLSAEVLAINALADSLTNSDLADDLRAHANELESIRTNELVALQDDVNVLKAELPTLENRTNELTSTSQTLVTDIDHVLTNSVALIEESENTFVLMLADYINQTLDYVLSQVKTNVGRCSPLYNTYRAIDYIICDNLLDSLNAMWLGLGTAVIFFIFGIIFAVKLSKYYRRMLHFDERSEGQEGYPGYNSKNYPV
ncbi:prominin-1-A-like [Apostichopus japonicus]|uniref:prominin-1-A-like n=1 Tax=Stichopus japonicus TaxID=307972 RepID=UPI003AB809C9